MISEPSLGSMALVPSAPEIYDAFEERRARWLWVRDPAIRPYPDVRRDKLERRAAHERAPTKSGRARLLLGYNAATYAEEQRVREAAVYALAAHNTPPPRKHVHVKGAMEWERNAWKVWDKKKVQEEARRDKYSTALTSYLGGQKLVHRFEPPAITMCAHCDLGGGLHPLRRCMGCMSVAYCCRLHQKAHWQWHKHICFAIRAANNLEARRGEGAGWVKLRPRRWRRPPIENGAIVETNCRARWVSHATRQQHATCRHATCLARADRHGRSMLSLARPLFSLPAGQLEAVLYQRRAVDAQSNG